MATRRFQTEEQLAAAAVGWLGDYGWDVYQEVQVQRNRPVADLVAVRHGIVWILEAKLSLSLTLLEQVWAWRGCAHYLSLLLPRARREPRGYRFTTELLRGQGVGWLEVGGTVDCPAVQTRLKPAVYRQARVAELVGRLHERQKTYAPAGNNRSRRWTPFQQTCEALREAVVAEPGVALTEALDRITHHYRSRQAAYSSLTKWLKQGVVTGLHLRLVDDRLRLYPDVGWDREPTPN